MLLKKATEEEKAMLFIPLLIVILLFIRKLPATSSAEFHFEFEAEFKFLVHEGKFISLITHNPYS